MSQHQLQRVVGRFEGALPGPLVIVVGALHGNEPAGVRAMEMIFEQLELERRDNPDFKFQGKLLGIIGNAQAFLIRQRFVEQDFNRVWTAEFLDQINALPKADLNKESLEAREVLEFITAECQSFSIKNTAFLDLHTTSADGGIFSIPTDETGSLTLAKHLGAPAIVGLQASISGTLLGFAAHGGFSDANGSINPPKSTDLPLCVAFESGQHTSPHAITRAAIAIMRCLRAMGSLAKSDLIDFEETLSLPFLAYVPPVVRFRYAHHIHAGDEFKMLPGYANFQPIMQGEHLADDVHGPVLSPENGLILMPLYQAKGSDGFFIVQ